MLLRLIAALLLRGPLRTCMLFDRLTIKDKFWRACSSIVPIELNTKYELKRSASRKIRVSWFWSSLKAPIPSLSTTRHLKGFYVRLSTQSIGLSQIHRPFVHGLIVGPTPKPLVFYCSRRMRLSKKDLPVLYLPATAMTPTYSSFKSIKKFLASGPIENPLKTFKVMTRYARKS